jgi:hypothetical protein
MPFNNVNVGKEFLLIQKCAFRQQAHPNFDNQLKLVVFYDNNDELDNISYECTFVQRNKYVLYCHTVKLTQKCIFLKFLLLHFYVIFADYNSF